MEHSLTRSVRTLFFTLFVTSAVFGALISCSNISSSPTGTVSFSISGDFAERALLTAKSRVQARAADSDTSADTASAPTDSETTLYLEISLNGDYSASKTENIKPDTGAVLFFDEIPAGAEVQVVAYVYSLETSENSAGGVRTNLFKAVSKRITIQEGENVLELVLKEYSDDSDNEGKSDETLINEAYDALSAGNYDRALAKFRAAYELNPDSDANKIYYALTELATLSTDETVADIIKNELGITNYPAELNAIFNPAWIKAINEPYSPTDSILNKDWLKSYPRYETLGAAQFTQNDSGEYIRVSGTPVNPYSSDVKGIWLGWGSYILYEDAWVNCYDYRSFTGDANFYLTNMKPDADGKYLVYFSNYYFPSSYSDATTTDKYVAQATEAISDYLYTRDKESGSETFIKSVEGDYVRLAGTETDSYTENSLCYSYKYDSDGSLSYTTGRIYTTGYIVDYSLSDTGAYFVDKLGYLYKYAQSLAKKDVSAYLYTAGDSYDKPVLGELLWLPEFAIPDWVKSETYFTGSLIDSVQTVKTWLYLLYANIVTNHENGFNDTLDKLISVVSAKRETVTKLVDSLGSGTARLDASLIKNLNLTEILGEDSLYFGKTEMNILASALEALDAALHFAASYDLTADLTRAKVGFELSHDEIMTVVNECVTAKTLSVRDESKLAESKTLLSSALSRLIASYEGIQKSTSYPQVAKDKISEYGGVLYSGAQKAKAALDSDGIFYLPKDNTATAFPEGAGAASFGIDFGKIFTAGYFTDIIERTEDKEKIRVYYKRYEYSWNSQSGSSETETEPEEITGNIADFESTIQDAGFSYSYDAETKTDRWADVRYEIGIMANKSLITAALPRITDFEYAGAERIDEFCFIPIFSIDD